jgi:nicotinamidase-related amidase
MPLIERDDSVLVVIDLQPRFRGDRLDAGDRHCVADAAARAAWLAAAATAWGIPAVVTEEAPDRKGPTGEGVLSSLPPGIPVLTKPVFGLAACPDIMAAIRATGRRAALLAGYETDVCVTHSAVGLGRGRLPGRRRRGRRVFAVRRAPAGPAAAA